MRRVLSVVTSLVCVLLFLKSITWTTLDSESQGRHGGHKGNSVIKNGGRITGDANREAKPKNIRGFISSPPPFSPHQLPPIRSSARGSEALHALFNFYGNIFINAPESHSGVSGNNFATDDDDSSIENSFINGERQHQKHSDGENTQQLLVLLDQSLRLPQNSFSSHSSSSSSSGASSSAPSSSPLLYDPYITDEDDLRANVDVNTDVDRFEHDVLTKSQRGGIKKKKKKNTNSNSFNSSAFSSDYFSLPPPLDARSPDMPVSVAARSLIDLHLRVPFLWGHEKKKKMETSSAGVSGTIDTNSMTLLSIPMHTVQLVAQKHKPENEEVGSFAAFSLGGGISHEALVEILENKQQTQQPQRGQQQRSSLLLPPIVGSTWTLKPGERGPQSFDSCWLALTTNTAAGTKMVESAAAMIGHFDVYPQNIPISPLFVFLVREVVGELKRGTMIIGGRDRHEGTGSPPDSPPSPSPSSPLCLPVTNASIYRMPPFAQDRDIAFQRTPFEPRLRPWHSQPATAPSIILEAPMGAIALFSHAPMSLRATRAMLRDPHSALTATAAVTPGHPSSFPSHFPKTQESKRHDSNQTRKKNKEEEESSHVPAALPPHIVRPKHRKALRVAVLFTGSVRDATLKSIRSIRENLLNVHNSIAVTTIYHQYNGDHDPAMTTAADEKEAERGRTPSKTGGDAKEKKNVGGVGNDQMVASLGDVSRAFGPYLAAAYVVDKAAMSTFIVRFMRKLSQKHTHGMEMRRSNRRMVFLFNIEVTSKLLRIVLGDEVEQLLYDRTLVEMQKTEKGRSGADMAAATQKAHNRRLYNLQRLFRLSLSRFPWPPVFFDVSKKPFDEQVCFVKKTQRYFRVNSPFWDYSAADDKEEVDQGSRNGGHQITLPALPSTPRAIMFAHGRSLLEGKDEKESGGSEMVAVEPTRLRDYLASYRPFYGARVDIVVALRSDLAIPFPISLRLVTGTEPMLVVDHRLVANRMGSAEEAGGVGKESEEKKDDEAAEKKKEDGTNKKKNHLTLNNALSNHLTQTLIETQTPPIIAAMRVHCSCHPSHCDAKGSGNLIVKDVLLRDMYASTPEAAAAIVRRRGGGPSKMALFNDRNKLSSSSGGAGGGASCFKSASSFSTSYPLRHGTDLAAGKVIHEVRFSENQVARAAGSPLFEYYSHPMSDLTHIGIDGSFLDGASEMFENIFVTDFMRRALSLMRVSPEVTRLTANNTLLLKRDGTDTINDDDEERCPLPIHQFLEPKWPSTMLINKAFTEYLVDEAFAIAGRYWAGGSSFSSAVRDHDTEESGLCRLVNGGGGDDGRQCNSSEGAKSVGVKFLNADGSIASRRQFFEEDQEEEAFEGTSAVAKRVAEKKSLRRLHVNTIVRNQRQRTFFLATNVNDDRVRTSFEVGVPFHWNRERRVWELRGGEEDGRQPRDSTATTMPLPASLTVADIRPSPAFAEHLHRHHHGIVYPPVSVGSVKVFIPSDTIEYYQLLVEAKTKTEKGEHSHRRAAKRNMEKEEEEKKENSIDSSSLMYPPDGVILPASFETDERSVNFLQPNPIGIVPTEHTLFTASPFLPAVDAYKTKMRDAAGNQINNNNNNKVHHHNPNLVVFGDKLIDVKVLYQPMRLQSFYRTSYNTGGGNDGGITVHSFGWSIVARTNQSNTKEKIDDVIRWRKAVKSVEPWNRWPSPSGQNTRKAPFDEQWCEGGRQQWTSHRREEESHKNCNIFFSSNSSASVLPSPHSPITHVTVIDQLGNRQRVALSPLNYNTIALPPENDNKNNKQREKNNNTSSQIVESAESLLPLGPLPNLGADSFENGLGWFPAMETESPFFTCQPFSILRDGEGYYGNACIHPDPPAPDAQRKKRR